LVSVFAAAATPAAPAAPALSARMDQSTVIIGTRFTVHVSVTHPPGMVVDLPVSLPLGTAFEEVGRKTRETKMDDGSVRRDFDIDLLVFELNVTEVPRIPITYVQAGRVTELTTQPITIEVKTASSEPPKPESLRDIAKPVPIHRRDFTLLYVAGGLFGGIILLWLVRRIQVPHSKTRRREEAAVAAESLLPEDEVALARLEQLELSGALDAIDLKPAYLEMSEILRVYLGRRYGFPAIDLTTEEIRLHFDAKPEHGLPIDLLLDWLDTADLVKFANAPARPEDAHGACNSAREIVKVTRIAETTQELVESEEVVASV
jgi:hypothetical protein